MRIFGDFRPFSVQELCDFYIECLKLGGIRDETRLTNARGLRDRSTVMLAISVCQNIFPHTLGLDGEGGRVEVHHAPIAPQDLPAFFHAGDLRFVPLPSKIPGAGLGVYLYTQDARPYRPPDKVPLGMLRGERMTDWNAIQEREEEDADAVFRVSSEDVRGLLVEAVDVTRNGNWFGLMNESRMSCPEDMAVHVSLMPWGELRLLPLDEDEDDIVPLETELLVYYHSYKFDKAPVLSWPDAGMDEIRKTLEDEGVVVVSGVVSEEVCQQAAHDIHAYVTSVSGVIPGDPSTYHRYIMSKFINTKRGETVPTVVGMLNRHKNTYCLGVVRAKTDPGLVEFFRRFWGTEDVVADDSGFLWSYPPEHATPKCKDPPPFYDYDTMWLHIDGHFQPQCLLMLEESQEYDSSFCYLRQSHRHNDEFRALNPTPSHPLSWPDVMWFHHEKQCPYVRVVAPAGSVVLWHPRTVHATVAVRRGRPNEIVVRGTDRSQQVKDRCVVYGLLTPRQSIDREARQATQRTYLNRRHHPSTIEFLEQHPDKANLVRV